MMHLLILILNDEKKFEEVMDAFLEVGIKGATIIDSNSMGKVISDNLPLFGGLRKSFEGDKPISKTILSIINDNLVDEAIKLLEKILKGEEDNSGVIIIIPVNSVFGASLEN